MSRELLEFSDLIDDQFEIADLDLETDEILTSILNLFIWSLFCFISSLTWLSWKVGLMLLSFNLPKISYLLPKFSLIPNNSRP